MARRRLNVLTWHVHGNYLHYLSHAPHDFHLVRDDSRGAGYSGLSGSLPWRGNLHDAPVGTLDARRFDCVLYQSRDAWQDRLLGHSGPLLRDLPRVYLEHDPPPDPTDSLHVVQDPNALLVHVTPFNALMWDHGVTPHRVIEHGVVLLDDVRADFELPRGIVVVNEMRRRGRRVGRDLFELARREIALELVGIDAESCGGLGEIGNTRLPAFMARHRFLFNPIRYTSLGLAVIEAMLVGLPVVALATTEMATVIEDGVSGFIDTRPTRLVAGMRSLIEDRALAARMGEAARRFALERFDIGRFARDWDETLRTAAGR